MLNRASFVRSNTSSLEIGRATCSSLATVPLVPFYSVTIPDLQLIGLMISPQVAVTASPSLKMDDKCYIHGVAWKTYFVVKDGFNTLGNWPSTEIFNNAIPLPESSLVPLNRSLFRRYY